MSCHLHPMGLSGLAVSYAAPIRYISSAKRKLHASHIFKGRVMFVECRIYGSLRVEIEQNIRVDSLKISPVLN